MIPQTRLKLISSFIGGTEMTSQASKKVDVSRLLITLNDVNNLFAQAFILYVRLILVEFCALCAELARARFPLFTA